MLYDRIKTLSDARNVSIYKLEKDLGFSNGTISKWNASNPTSDKLRSVASYLGVTMEFLLEDEKQEV